MTQQIINGIAAPNMGNGRKFGYPTANIPASTDLEEGVYAGFTTLNFGKLKYVAMPSFIFIGNPETLNEEGKRVETHIFDIPDIDYYGAEIHVKLTEKIRENRKFDSVDQLLQQMKLDELKARQLLAQSHD